MTKTEAIAELSVLHERLSNPKDCEDGCYSWEDGWYVEAIDMAIEALSQPIVCKDYRIDDDHIYCSPKVADRVVEALSADAVEVVRCKDCKFKDSETGCPLGELLDDKGFCSLGERREDGEA